MRTTKKTQSRVPALSVTFAASIVLLVFGVYMREPTKSFTQGAELQRCLAKPELARMVQEFSPKQRYRELEEARLRLMNNAKISTKCRREVIDAIIEAMDKPQLDAYRDFTLWRYGSTLLGDLKATEGLDLLIKHLSFTDGTSINIAHYPAMIAVMDIGRPALPKLGVALRQNSDVSYRYKAVFCIAQIGGPIATHELRTALISESDSCVHKFIQISIEVLNNPRAPGRISTEEDRERWYAALTCKE